MKKNLCILVLSLILIMTVSTAAPLTGEDGKFKLFYKTFNFWGYLTNTLDFMMTYMTVLYCFNMGLFNVFFYNDGGQTLYDCMDANVKTIKFY